MFCSNFPLNDSHKANFLNKEDYVYEKNNVIFNIANSGNYGIF